MSGATPSLTVVQLSTDDLGTPLADATFVIVDLETTGGSPRDGGITEIGAVKVRGGECIAEFASLVNPGRPIPAFIAALTGITNPMVASAPRTAPVLASFLEFARGATLVAHNAPYDIGFLKGACAQADLAWPTTRVVDTARIARTALLRDEVANCRLETLARHFGTSTQPTHRALDDARATVEVFHALLARLGGLGVQSLEDLQAFTGRVHPAQRTKRTLADGLPQRPGVYVFRDSRNAPLYIGTSGNIARRVRSYFTASETRRRMTEMIRIAERVDAIPCATQLEAQIREIRLIAQEQPRYNRRGRGSGALTWLRVAPHTVSIARSVAVGASSEAVAHPQPIAYLGPWPSKAAAEPTRQGLLWLQAHAPGSLGAVSRLDATTAIQHLMDLIHDLAAGDQFEAAARWRDVLTAVLAGLVRTARLQTLARTAEVIALRQGAPSSEGPGRWEVHCIRYGSLAGAAALVAPPSLEVPQPAVDALRECSAHVAPPTPGDLSTSLAEAETVAHWLELDRVRLVATSTPLAWPVAIGGSTLDRLRSVTRPESSGAGPPSGPVGGLQTRISVRQSRAEAGSPPDRGASWR